MTVADSTFSPFQQAVYDVVRGIPKGSVLTYAQVAQALRARGIGACSQAVGQALRRNHYPIDKPRADGFYVPCHRVVASGTCAVIERIGGFAGKSAGDSIARKKRLLEAEGVKR